MVKGRCHSCYGPPRRSHWHFDPRKLAPLSKNPPIQVQIRLPMSIRCDTCRKHICQGTILYPWKEKLVGERHMGIQRYRLYFNCPKCADFIKFKFYPKDPNFVVESGATKMTENEKREEEAREMGNRIKSLQLDDINSIKKYKDSEDEEDEDSEDEEDEDSEDEEDLTRPCASYDEAVNNALKKREFSEEFLDKPTDSLTKATTSGSCVGSLDRSGREPAPTSRLVSNH